MQILYCYAAEGSGAQFLHAESVQIIAFLSRRTALLSKYLTRVPKMHGLDITLRQTI